MTATNCLLKYVTANRNRGHKHNTDSYRKGARHANNSSGLAQGHPEASVTIQERIAKNDSWFFNRVTKSKI